MTYPVMSYAAAHAWEHQAAERGVSEVARSSRGFMRAYERAGSFRALDPWWQRRREGFIARHMAQANRGERLWEKVRGSWRPTRRALALIMWAYMPPGRPADASPQTNPVVYRVVLRRRNPEISHRRRKDETAYSFWVGDKGPYFLLIGNDGRLDLHYASSYTKGSGVPPLQVFKKVKERLSFHRKNYGGPDFWFKAVDAKRHRVFSRLLSRNPVRKEIIHATDTKPAERRYAALADWRKAVPLKRGIRTNPVIVAPSVPDYPGKEVGDRVSKVQVVPRRLIEPTERTSAEKVATFTRSIRAGESIEAILVEFGAENNQGEDTLAVVDGHHRLAALDALKVTEIPVRTLIRAGDEGGLKVRFDPDKTPIRTNPPQRTPYTCGPAVALDVLADHGVRATERAVAAVARSCKRSGTTAGGLVRALRAGGVSARALKPSTVRAGDLVRLWSGDEDHWVRVRSVTAGRAYVTFYDPWTGRSRTVTKGIFQAMRRQTEAHRFSVVRA